ncbi:transposase [Streptomyces longwoodensis]|uniref:transposase n=1 Tax=Streptomyces longwoodensis TaxID=68231 RepID=UPI003F4D4D1B
MPARTFSPDALRQIRRERGVTQRKLAAEMCGVTITGVIPKPRLGLACSMRDWFTAAQRLAPDELTDQAWALVEPIVKAWEPPYHRLRPGRLMLDAMFYKARTGCRWEDLPERFGSWKGIHSRYKTWRNCGVWDDIMAALPNTGRPVWTPPQVPPLRVEGRVDPRVLIGVEEKAVSGETGVPGPRTSAHRPRRRHAPASSRTGTPRRPRRPGASSNWPRINGSTSVRRRPTGPRCGATTPPSPR